MRTLAIAVVLLFSGFPASRLAAQHSHPDTLYALRIDSPIRVDGRLDEPVWHQAMHIANFTQRELNEGEPATERTEVAVVYNDHTLYVGVWCFDSRPEGIIAQMLERDFNWRSDDNFEIIIDTYHDRRNGYLFVTNPNGARADVLVLDNGRQFNRDWDGVWEVATQITAEGWFAEFAIPFSTLKFPRREELVWGINFERNIRRKREQVLWQGWSRDADLEQVNRAGTLVGLWGISAVQLMEFKPFVSGGVENRLAGDTRSLSKVGGDLIYLVTPTVKLNVTINTDFAQVESDRAQVNLTRFSLFYPEKREFFLEGQNFFGFDMGRNILPFYSRRIGISPQRTEIPILGGVRLLGKQGNSTFGVMSLQTARRDSFPSTNYSVVRWRQDVLAQSTVGLLSATRWEPDRFNATYGIDFLYSTSRLFGDKNFAVSGAFVHSYTSNRPNRTGAAHRLTLSYPNDFTSFDFGWERADASFNPEVGFLRRTNYQQIFGELQFSPRPRMIRWIRQMEFKPIEFNYYLDDDTHALSSFSAEFQPLGVSTRSGESLEFNIQRQAENLPEPFEIFEDVVLDPGEYWFTRYELQLETYQARPLSGEFSYNWGAFYRGQRQIWSYELQWRLNKHIRFRGDYERNTLDLPEGRFTVHELGGRIDFATSPDLFGSFFGQWNNEDREILLNFRINWIPSPGSNFYFVVNQSIDTRGSRARVRSTTVLSKFVWRFVR